MGKRETQVKVMRSFGQNEKMMNDKEKEEEKEVD